MLLGFVDDANIIRINRRAVEKVFRISEFLTIKTVKTKYMFGHGEHGSRNSTGTEVELDGNPYEVVE